jgi:hypothetical protein
MVLKWREVQVLLEEITLIKGRICFIGANINKQSKSLSDDVINLLGLTYHL